MDRSKAGAGGRRRVAVAPCLEHLEGRRLLTVSFMEGTTSGSPLLLIAGTPRSDTINITDDGSGGTHNITVTTGDGTTYSSHTAISTIEVDGKGGNDRITYTLTGDLTAPRTLVVDLGAGNNQFTANVGTAINNSFGLDLEIYGGAGKNNLSVNQTGPVLNGTFFPHLIGGSGSNTLIYNGTGDIAAGASISPALEGIKGNNKILSTYSGQIDGNYIYNLAVQTGQGNDNIDNEVYVAPGSTGTVGTNANTPAVIEAGKGKDQIRYAIRVDPAAPQAQVFAKIMGGSNRDKVQRTSNVQADPSIKNDTVIS